jgi:CIC family chloride channel protein
MSVARLQAFFGRHADRRLVLGGAVGVLTGLSVSLFEWVTREQIFQRILAGPLWVKALAPTVGLALAALALRHLAGGASPATSDEYIRSFHLQRRALDLRPVLGRLVAGVTTLGSGGALGFEGPSLYAGAAIGTAAQRRFDRRATGEDSKLLMVAGAAAGVAAIFKAPATGAVFALEVPYRDDTARHMLLPSLLAAAAGYLTTVALLGPEPIFEVEGSPPFGLRELGGAAVLGLVCGIGARAFALLLRRAKDVASGRHAIWRVVGAGIVLAVVALASSAIFDEDLALGSGYRTLQWVTEPGHSIPLILSLLAFRVAASTATLAGGGVGGLFIPLVLAGALVGDAGSVLLGDQTNLFPLIGVAAFLGAGYRTPLAGVMFVAETTGRPGFVVPALIASVAAQLVMGDVSVSTYQQSGRGFLLRGRLRLPVHAVLDAEATTVPPDATLAELYEHHLLLQRRLEVPVTDGSRYVGMASADQLQHVERSAWDQVTVGDVADDGWPTARVAWRLGQVVDAMDRAGVDVLPVVEEGTYVGLVRRADVLRLDEILETTDAGEGPAEPRAGRS